MHQIKHGRGQHSKTAVVLVVMMGAFLLAGCGTPPPPFSETASPLPSGYVSLNPSGSSAVADRYAVAEGYWIAAGGPPSVADIAAAITIPESSTEPGMIQYGCNGVYIGCGWGLWQITSGNTESEFGTNYQILDPWNNAEAAIAKYNGDIADGLPGFQPWRTWLDGAYLNYLQTNVPPAPVTMDPGQYEPTGGTPPPVPSGDGDSVSQPGVTMPQSAAPMMSQPIAFQANNGYLYTWCSAPNSPGGGIDTQQGMMAATSPAIAQIGNGQVAIAFQANNGYLYTWVGSVASPTYGGSPESLCTVGGATPGPTNTGLGMMAGTSPSITALPTGGYLVAFQANTGDLWVVGSGGASGPGNTAQGMASGTSPSITAPVTGGYEVAFQANSGVLVAYGSAANVNTGLGMASGTSPSITSLQGSLGGVAVAFQDNTGLLHTWCSTCWYNGTQASQASGVSMKSGTSPAIASLENGSSATSSAQSTEQVAVVFQEYQGDLWTWGGVPGISGYSGTDSGLGMDNQTSPSIVWIGNDPSGLPEIAAVFQANTGALWTYYGEANGGGGYGSASTNQGMLNGTSPGID